MENLRVSDIVICGHSQCGAITAMLGKNPVSDSMPHLRDWLKLAAPVLETLKKDYAHLHETAARETAAAEENVLFGLDNLHSYSVRAGTADGRFAAAARLVLQDRHGGIVRLRSGNAAIFTAGAGKIVPAYLPPTF